jgi:hypothetical protein
VVQKTQAVVFFRCLLCPLCICQVKLLITNNAFCIVQRATAQSKTGIFRDFGVAEAPPGFQAGWSDCMYLDNYELLKTLPVPS